MNLSRIRSVLSLLAAIAVAGCSSESGILSPGDAAGGTSGHGNKTTITFWAASVTPERKAFFEQTVKTFEEQYPDIHVEYLGVPGDISAYEQKLDVAIAAGQAPDITNDFKADYIARGVYEPLDDYFNHWNGKNAISQGALQSNRLLDAKEGKLYALPYSSQTWNLWVRNDWFKEANVPLPDTWHQFFEALPKLMDKSNERYALSIRGGAGSANTLEALMYTYSGIGDYFTADGRATINHPKHVEFAEKYLGAYSVYTPEDDLSKGWTEIAATFQSGKAGMVVHNLGSASSHEKAFNGDRSKFMALPFPKNDKGERVHPGLMPLGLTMSRTSKNKDAVWKFMTFYLSKEVNSQYGKLYGEIPANNEASRDTWVQEIPYMKSAADLLTSKDTKFSKNPYYLPGYNKVQKNMEPLIQKVMAKKMTAKELLDEWAKQLEKEEAAYSSRK